jgi:hypothetical protein
VVPSAALSRWEARAYGDGLVSLFGTLAANDYSPAGSVIVWFNPQDPSRER